MNTLNLTNDSIRKYIPNVMAEVEGESPLFEKLAPFINSAKMWLESEFLGTDDFLSPQHNELARKIVVTKAFLAAVPSLDLILTPSGFGVISTESMVPVSKERVERLVESLRSYIKANLALLVDICRSYQAWRDSERGQYFSATFFPSPSDYSGLAAERFSSYDEMRARCLLVEAALAERYIGRNLMARLRSEYFAGTANDVAEAIRYAVMWMFDKNGRFDQNALWHAAEPVIAAIRVNPDCLEHWQNEMGPIFESQEFKNNTKGGFYF